MLRTVLKNGEVHLEYESGNMRHDMTTGATKVVLPGTGATRTVMGPGGTTVETTTGNMRTTLGSSVPEWIVSPTQGRR